MQGHHVDGLVQLKTGFVHHRAHEAVGGGDAAGKAGEVHHIGDAVLDDDLEAILAAAQHGRAFRHARAAHAVGDQRDLAVVLALEDHAQQLRRQVLAVGDDFNVELVKAVAALDHAQHAHALDAHDGGHAGVEMREMGIAVLQALLHGFIGGVAVADGHENALFAEHVAQLHGALELRRDGPAEDVAVAALKDLLVVLLLRGDQIARRLRAGLILGEVRALEVHAAQARHILGDGLGLLIMIEEIKKLFVGAGQRGRGDGGGAVDEMGARGGQDIADGAVHKVAVPAAVAVQVDKAGGEDHALAVGLFAGDVGIGDRAFLNMGDFIAVNDKKTVRNRFRFGDDPGVIKNMHGHGHSPPIAFFSAYSFLAELSIIYHPVFFIFAKSAKSLSNFCLYLENSLDFCLDGVYNTS